jgi:hypothetical protein
MEGPNGMHARPPHRLIHARSYKVREWAAALAKALQVEQAGHRMGLGHRTEAKRRAAPVAMGEAARPERRPGKGSEGGPTDPFPSLGTPYPKRGLARIGRKGGKSTVFAGSGARKGRDSRRIPRPFRLLYVPTPGGSRWPRRTLSGALGLCEVTGAEVPGAAIAHR